MYGPEQVEARIDNDQDISAWFTLRCSEGSTCIRGNLLVIPVGNSILYAEPVYIQAEGVSFPELKKVILATADRVVMADSLAEALYDLTGEIRKEIISAEEAQTNRASSELNIDQADKIKDSLDNLRKELDALEALLESLEQGE